MKTICDQIDQKKKRLKEMKDQINYKRTNVRDM